MDTLFNILFWIHLLSLGLGGAAVFGIPVVGSRIAGAPPETRPLLFGIAGRLSMIGRTAIGLLLVTGPLMVWLHFGGVDGFSWWFWLKMVLVALLLAVVIFSGINAGKAAKGDRAAAQLAPRLSMVAIVVFVAIILSAVFAFN